MNGSRPKRDRSPLSIGVAISAMSTIMVGTISAAFDGTKRYDDNRRMLWQEEYGNAEAIRCRSRRPSKEEGMSLLQYVWTGEQTAVVSFNRTGPQFLC